MDRVPDSPLFGHVLDPNYVAPPNDGWLDIEGEEEDVVQQQQQQPQLVHEVVQEVVQHVAQENIVEEVVQEDVQDDVQEQRFPSPHADAFEQENVDELADLEDLGFEDFETDEEYNARMLTVPSGRLPRQPTQKRQREDDDDPNYEPLVRVRRTVTALDVSTSNSRPQTYEEKRKAIMVEDDEPEVEIVQTVTTQTTQTQHPPIQTQTQTQKQIPIQATQTTHIIQTQTTQQIIQTPLIHSTQSIQSPKTTRVFTSPPTIPITKPKTQSPNAILLTPLSQMMHDLRDMLTPPPTKLSDIPELQPQTSPTFDYNPESTPEPTQPPPTQSTPPPNTQTAQTQTSPLSPLIDVYTIMQDQLLAAEVKTLERFKKMEKLAGEQTRLILA